MNAEYAAGLFDGEGWINVIRRPCKTKRHGHAIQVGIAMTDRRPLEVLQVKYGGSLCALGKRPNRLQLYKWQLSTKCAYHFLSEILPFSYVKKEKLENALRFYDFGKWNRQKGRPWSEDAAWQERENIRLENLRLRDKRP